MTAPWTLSGLAALASLKSSAKGLAQAEAAGRLATYGANRVVEHEQRGWPTLLARQFLGPLSLILIFGAIMSLALSALAVALVALALPFVPLSRETFGLVPLGPALLATTIGMTLVYARSERSGEALAASELSRSRTSQSFAIQPPGTHDQLNPGPSDLIEMEGAKAASPIDDLRGYRIGTIREGHSGGVEFCFASERSFKGQLRQASRKIGSEDAGEVTALRGSYRTSREPRHPFLGRVRVPWCPFRCESSGVPGPTALRASDS